MALLSFVKAVSRVAKRTTLSDGTGALLILKGGVPGAFTPLIIDAADW